MNLIGSRSCHDVYRGGAGLSVNRKYDVTFILEKRIRGRGDRRMEQSVEDYKVFTSFYNILLSVFKRVNVHNRPPRPG